MQIIIAYAYYFSPPIKVLIILLGYHCTHPYMTVYSTVAAGLLFISSRMDTLHLFVYCCLSEDSKVSCAGAFQMQS